MKSRWSSFLLALCLLAAPATGNAPPAATNECLLVVDMQARFFQMKQPVFQAESLVRAVSNAIRNARANGLLVVYTQQENKAALHPGTPGWKILRDLQPAPGDVIIRKRLPGVFQDTPLEKLLRQRGITRLRICGLLTNGSVKDACLTALDKGYAVTLIANGHSTFFHNAPRLVADWNQRLREKGVRLLRE